jgi:hypothetical protein
LRCQVWVRKTNAVQVSKVPKTTSKPEFYIRLRDKSGGCPFIGQAVSGIEAT